MRFQELIQIVGLGFPRLLRIESPRFSMRCALCTSRSKDAVSKSRIANLFVPACDRQWRSQDRRAYLIAILADLPKVAALGFG